MNRLLLLLLPLCMACDAGKVDRDAADATSREDTSALGLRTELPALTSIIDLPRAFTTHRLAGFDTGWPSVAPDSLVRPFFLDEYPTYRSRHDNFTLEPGYDSLRTRLTADSAILISRYPNALFVLIGSTQFGSEFESHGITRAFVGSLAGRRLHMFMSAQHGGAYPWLGEGDPRIPVSARHQRALVDSVLEGVSQAFLRR